MRNKISAKITGLTALAATIIAITSFAQSEPVYSVNIIGMQKQPVVEDLQMMSNPFEAMTIRELVGNSGVHGTSESTADNVILFDSVSQEYQTYYLRSHSSVGIEWRRLTTWATNVYINPGQSFFYRSRLNTVRTNTVVGDVVLDVAITNTIRPGLQLISYPYSSRIRLSDMNLKQGVHGTSESVADNVIVYDANSKEYLTYYLRSHSSVGIEWRRLTTWATNVYLEPGQGFFYRSRGIVDYEWIEQNPYPDI